MFVDHIDEKKGEEKAGDEAEDVTEKTDHPGFDQYGLFDLLSRCPYGPENSDISLPFHDQGVEGTDNSEEGNKEGDQLERISDRKGLIEDLENFIS